ncbi:MAG: MarC family protein [Acetobacteraceae bacterium]|nr:MarC family protein [Acetobacteraceae bacterium]
MYFGEISNAFLLALPALFSIINPIAGALIFHEATLPFTHEQRARLAWKVGFNSLIVMLAALWAGSYVLAFFGISVAALRIAGGLVVALFAWELLKDPENWEARRRDQAASSTGEDIAFFPLTLPITTGPGAISVAVALGAVRPEPVTQALQFFAGVSAAAAVMAVVIFVLYRSADSMARFLGPSGERILTRLSAFLLLCIGVQIMITGAMDLLHGKMATP